MPFSVKQLTLLISVFSSFTATGAAPASYAQNQTSEYDIIVVGGGAGGLVAATKFAESGMNTLLLEHGGPMLYLDGNREFPSWTQAEYPGNNLTIHDGMLFYVSAYTNPNNWCTNLPSGLLAACQLGGGTAINAAQQFWPPKKYLTNAYGNMDGWIADAFQPAIQRVASRIPPTPYWSADNKFYYDQVYDIMGAPLTKLGLLEVNTTSEGDKKYDNYGRDVFAAVGGQRGGPMRGYLQDAKKLPNFTMKLYSPVTSVVRNGSQITGVKVNGTTINAKSVVLSAGVWNTPSLLFASGIGPKSVLDTAASINFTTYQESDWIINNGVGANLHDNPMTSIAISLNDTSSAPFYSLSNALNGSLPQADKDALYFNRSGPLTSPGRQLVGWIEEPFPNDSSKSMVIQTICSTPTAVDGQFTCQWNLNEGLLSRGQIILGTDGNLAFEGGVGPWLSDPEGIDVQVFAGALKRMVASINTTPGMTVTTPASNVTDYVSFLNTAAKRSNNHWGGSCTVGTTDGTKNGADCVDLNAKVYGTNNLFVIDGSLSRAPTTSNPAFLYEAIAELASVKVMESLGVKAKLSNAVRDIPL